MIDKALEVVFNTSAHDFGMLRYRNLSNIQLVDVAYDFRKYGNMDLYRGLQQIGIVTELAVIEAEIVRRGRALN